MTATGMTRATPRNNPRSTTRLFPGAAAPSAPGRNPAPWQADPYTRALHTGHGPLFLRRTDGWLLPLEVERWCATPDRADHTVLERCRGNVLDVGCGPGRFVSALAATAATAPGGTVLGIDVSHAAVTHTLRAGGSALMRSVFDPLPLEGRWDTALLIDGNIGIGGDPAALLGRLAEIVSPNGTLIVETAPQGLDQDLDERVRVQVDNGTGFPGEAFPWARVGVRSLIRHSTVTQWWPAEQWIAGDRTFVSLRR